MAKKHQHPGPCTTGTLFTKTQAVAKLHEMGFTFDKPRCEWKRGDEAGRLQWSPDFCNPDNFESGTAFWLQKPHGGGIVNVLAQA